ncbi:hypothetical protein O3M35_010220 [Rhynocoris fuscipes]|uniref:Uncharacterized protein n=1 Tax=Rhynocoris fuscipes TaxID=488301 RepID=A0AAW1D3J7_9HEMI
MSRVSLFLLLVAFGLVESAREKIPSFIKICKRTDPNLDECVKDSVEKIRPHLSKGIPELGIPGCEPLILPEIIMNQGKGSVSVQSKYSNIKIFGPSQFILKSVKLDLDNDKVKIKLWLPRLETSGDYTINGRILMLPIAGQGISRGNYSDIEATAIMEGEKFIKGGKTYYNVKEFWVDFNIGHASVHLSNLFNGDQQLGEAMNEFLNENWQNVADEMKPVLEKTIGDLFKKFSNRIYHKYPLDELLPT